MTVLALAVAVATLGLLAGFIIGYGCGFTRGRELAREGRE